MGKTGSTTNGKRVQAAKKAKAGKATVRAPRGKPAAKARGAGTKAPARKTTNSNPGKKAKARLTLVPPPRPAKPSQVAKQSKRATWRSPSRS